MFISPPVILPSSNGFVDGNAVLNQLLVKLPAAEAQLLFPELVFMPLRTHDVLNELGQTIQYCYFLNSGLASVLNVMEDGKSVEVGLSGKEGFVGSPVLVGFQSSPSRVIIQSMGPGSESTLRSWSTFCQFALFWRRDCCATP